MKLTNEQVEELVEIIEDNLDYEPSDADEDGGAGAVLFVTREGRKPIRDYIEGLEEPSQE